MRPQQTLLASTRQFPHGLCATMKLNMANVLEEISFLVFMSEVSGHVGEPLVMRVTFDEGGEEGDIL